MDYAELVPQRLDIFAFIIFLGVVQGFFFAYFLLQKSQRLNPKNQALGLYLLINTSVLLEVFLCYTGLIVHVLWLVDYSEATNFLSGPILYMLVIAFLGKELPKRWSLHYLPFVLYLGYMVLFFVQPETYKFNAYIDAYYPDLPKIDGSEITDPDPLNIKQHINQISVAYTAVYIIWGLVTIVTAVRKEGLRLFKGAEKDIAWVRNLLVLGLIGYLFWLVKSVTGLRDVQDHIGATIHTVIIYFVGFRILQQAFIAQRKSSDKYAKSSLSEDRRNQILHKLESLQNESDFFLENTLSMNSLASRIGVSHHHLSQVLNEVLGKTYGEYINELRIAHAQKVLIDRPHLKIEEVAEQAGFNSKSTFNTAFKKLTGQTPSQYRSGQL